MATAIVTVGDVSRASGRALAGVVLGTLTVLLLTACIARQASARAPSARKAVRYHVEIPEPTSQYVHVRLSVEDPRGASSDVAMPAWAPGSYLIRDFARHVYDVRATRADGSALAVSRRDKQTWRVHHGGRPFSVRYRVFAADVGARTSHVDDRHASLVGTSVFAYVVGELSRPATVEVHPPAGWTVHVALRSESNADGGVTIHAADYDRLVDAPLELGTPTVERFEVDGAAFEYILTGGETLQADPARLAADARKIVGAYADLMQDLPMRRYLFLVEATGAGGGGLEHENSTSMILRRGMFSDDDGYLRAARLAAHEFFHAWNVKRIHDRVLGPFDYARENHSRLLWFHEGFTETMESLAMVRAGLVSADDYLRALARSYSRYRAHPGRNHDPLSQLSFEAWTKGYKPADNHRNVAISYYTKGDMVGVALDLELRLRSKGQGSLPGLFRRLMNSHGTVGRGITQRDIVDAATMEAGQPMDWFFAKFVEGTDEVELPPLLTAMGIEVSEMPAKGVFTGLSLAEDGRVRDVEVDSPAAEAGFMRGDRMVAVDGHRADSRTRAQRWLSSAEGEPTASVAVYRADRLVQLSLAVLANPAKTWTFVPSDDEGTDAAKRALRQAWLAGPSPATAAD